MTGVILTYHAVENGPRPLCIEPALFAEHAAAIAASGATCLTVRELGAALRDGALPERAVAITFDDGCESAATNAAPILAEHGLRATVFCVAGHLGQANDWPGQRGSTPSLRLASAEQLAELARQGFEIGSHGYAHAALSDISPSDATREIDDSKVALEAAADVPVSSFAWPYGARPGAEPTRLIRAGYLAACTTAMARVGPDADPLSLPRVDAYYVRRPELLRSVLEGARDEYLRLRAVAARARRLFRKDYE
jgi:peptidoglycan/xylan/chitin deacetylase (PgdA/CDA1 family)